MICPNPDCPDRTASGVPAEYRDGIATCPVCGAALADREPGPQPAPGAAPVPAGTWDGVPVLVTRDLSAADLAAGVLESEEIPFYRRARVLGGLTLGMGNAAPTPGQQNAIFVPETAADRARELLAGIGLSGDDGLDGYGAVPEGGPAGPGDDPIGPGMPPDGGGTLRRVVVVAFLLLAAVVVVRLLASLLASSG